MILNLHSTIEFLGLAQNTEKNHRMSFISFSWPLISLANIAVTYIQYYHTYNYYSLWKKLSTVYDDTSVYRYNEKTYADIGFHTDECFRYISIPNSPSFRNSELHTSHTHDVRSHCM
jgi:hypothetical protein